MALPNGTNNKATEGIKCKAGNTPPKDFNLLILRGLLEINQFATGFQTHIYQSFFNYATHILRL